MKIIDRKLDWRLCFIVDSEALSGKNWLKIMSEAGAGGVTLIQLRSKTWKDHLFLQNAFLAKQNLDRAGLPLIINDRADIALAVRAAGVHLGQDDLPVVIARQLLGPEALIGISVHDVKEAKRAEQQGADYVGAGPVFWTGSKRDVRQPIGIEGLKAICAAVSIPVLAIGGLTAETARQAMAAGAAGIAVIGAIASSDDPRAAAARLKREVASKQETS